VSDAFVIETSDLRKHYDTVEAIRGLDLQVPAGSICGFLGKNGAGKTTTIKLLLGMARPTSGHARVLGRDAAVAGDSVEIRRRTGFVSDDKDLYGYMTVDEMIRFTAAFFPSWRADLAKHYVRRFDLPGDRRIKALSRGTVSKLALLLAFCRGAELLILDEPTSGLDPAMSEEVLQALVTHVASEQTSVFFSSHQIAEVEQVADRVAIIDRGRMTLSGGLDDLRANFRRIHMVFDRDAPQPQFRAAAVERVSRSGRVLSVLSSAGAEAVLEEVRPLGALSVEVLPVSLKEIFLETVKAED
jgi:ABC-2 type transport system ATP-binding protein